MAGKKQGSCPKTSRFGSKQHVGSSRARYFAARKLFIAARNKARAIKRGLQGQVEGEE